MPHPEIDVCHLEQYPSLKLHVPQAARQFDRLLADLDTLVVLAQAPLRIE